MRVRGYRTIGYQPEKADQEHWPIAKRISHWLPYLVVAAKYKTLVWEVTSLKTPRYLCSGPPEQVHRHGWHDLEKAQTLKIPYSRNVLSRKLPTADSITPRSCLQTQRSGSPPISTKPLYIRLVHSESSQEHLLQVPRHKLQIPRHLRNLRHIPRKAIFPSLQETRGVPDLLLRHPLERLMFLGIKNDG